MKKYSTFIILVFTGMLATSSCKKDRYPAKPIPARTIQFTLYTEKDFSDDNHNITFSVFIRTHTRTLFDSTLSVMKIKDIPGTANKIVIEKKVPNDDGSDLAVGFNYTIENVGISWHTDTCQAGNTFKIVNFAFQ